MSDKSEVEQTDSNLPPPGPEEGTPLPITEDNHSLNVDPEDAAEAYGQDTSDTLDADEISQQSDDKVDLILDGDEEIDLSRYEDDEDDEESEIDVSRYENDSDEIDLIAHKRVLLVEDDQDTAQIITDHLKAMRVRDVYVVNNVDAAYFQITRDRELFPDIVLLELALPGTDGIQLLARLRAHKNPRVQNLPAVVITLLESPGIFRRAARQKVGAFLKKPISRDGLRIGMEEAFKGNIVEKPFSKPKSWLDEFEEDELLKKQDEIKAKAAAKIAKKGFLVRLMSALIPWSGRAD